MTPLADQLAVVTGARSGIGKALALALGAQGAEQALVGRHSGPLETVAQQARAAGAKALACLTDLTRPCAIRDLGAALERDFGRVDVLIHSAAVAMLGAVADAAAEDFDTHYRTNLLGPYLLSQRLLPMLRKRRGQVVFIKSLCLAPTAEVTDIKIRPMMNFE